MRVGLATCLELPEPDPDAAPLRAALAASGVDAVAVAWDDPRADLSGLDLCVLRSTWNYVAQPDAFRRWIARAGEATRLRNPPDVVLGNLHKGYLRALAEEGVPVVATEWVPRGRPPALAGVMARRGWREVVVKPAVSAGSWRTARFAGRDVAEAGQAFLDALCAERDAMIQPYLRCVESGGERALVWIDGAFTHAIPKSLRFDGAREAVAAARAPTAAESAFGERVLAAVRGELLYARVDVIEDDAGRLLLSELELTEPSLYLVQCEAALARFAGAIVRAARSAAAGTTSPASRSPGRGWRNG